MKAFQEARHNMITHQIRPWQVLDEKVLSIMSEVQREKFVPKKYHNLAYADVAIPLGNGHQMLQPKIIGRALQALNIQPSEIVLEIGTGTGYLTALLAQLAKHVYSVEIEPDLFKEAINNVGLLTCKNITLEEGDAANGWMQHSPYNVIIVCAAYPVELPSLLKDQLTVGGRCFAIIGEGPNMKAILFTKGATQWHQKILFETMVPPLLHASKHSDFIF